MTPTLATQLVREEISRLSAQALAFAALGRALDVDNQRALPTDVDRCVREVLAVLGVEDALSALDARDARTLLAELRVSSATHEQLLRGESPGWAPRDPNVLRAAGEATARFAHTLKAMIGPELEGLLPRLNAPTARFLDVGCGVGALSIEMARVFSTLRVVGVDIHEPALLHARANVRNAGLEERVELRAEPAESLHDEDAFDLVWLPGLFVSAASLRTIIHRSIVSLRSGGYLLCVALKQHGDALAVAAARVRTAQWGGSMFSATDVGATLKDAGFSNVRLLPNAPTNVTQLLAARKA